MLIKLSLIYVIVFVFLLSTVTAQQKLVSGVLFDEHNQFVSGVYILEKGTNNSTITNLHGGFSLMVGINSKIVISGVGYSDKEISVADSSNFTIFLLPASTELSTVIITALGVAKQKRSLGYSASSIKGGDFAKANEINPVNALQGKVAGVQIDQGAGGLFGSTRILIRGNSTLGVNNQPIFVIDGVIMDNEVFGGTGRDFGNDFKNLNPEDFETISILRGSAAAALYGSRAINGVVLITTKKGTQRKGIGASVSQSLTISNAYAGPDFQNEFGGGTVGAFFTDSRDPNYPANSQWVTKIFPVNSSTNRQYIDRQIGRELENWGPRMIGQSVLNYDGTETKYLPQPDNYLQAFQTGFGYNTNLALEGGTEKSTMRVSFNHNQGNGISPNNELKKYAFDLRTTHQLANFLSVDAGVAYSNFFGQNPPRLGDLDAFSSYNFGKLFSWVLPRNYDTRYWMQKNKYTSYLGGVPEAQNSSEPNKAPESRFWFNIFNNKYLQTEQLLRSRLTITATLNSWAKLVMEGNLSNVNSKQENKELGILPNFDGGLYGLGFESKQSRFLKIILQMAKDINKDFSINGYVGAETQNNETNFEYSETNGGLISPSNFFLANSLKQIISTGGISSRKKFNSQYVSVDLSYKNLAFLQATWRGDWSSALAYRDGSGNSFYNYPAASISWVFTESISKLPSWISYGKLRANIAALGTDTDPFTINPGFVFSSLSLAAGGSRPTTTFSALDAALKQSYVLQKNLKPARKVSKELGLELRFIKSKFGIDISFYKDNTKNQILNIPVPLESGVNNFIINAGHIQNSGIEITIDAMPFRTKDFNWSTAITYSTNSNKIISLHPGINEYSLSGTNIRLGEISTWAIAGKSYGIIRSNINSQPFQAKDADGKDIIDDPRNGLPILSWRDDARAAFPARSNVLKDVGNINAKFRAGWDNTFRYKNFDLNILLDAKIGGDFVLASYRFGTHTGAFPNSIFGRDAQSGGITFTSKYDGITYDDGRIVNGVFAPNQMITLPDKTKANVGGKTFKEAYELGIIEPTHTPQFFYRYGSSSTGVSDYWVLENSWIALRQLALSYNFPKKIIEKLSLNSFSISLVGRDLLYLYQTLPHNFNPASNNSNNTAFSGEEGFLPKTRNINFTIKAVF